MDTTEYPVPPELIVSVSVLASILVITFLTLKVIRQKVRDPRVSRIASYIESGASAFLRTEYSVIIMFDALLAVILLIFLGFKTAVAFILGAALSLASGFLGMKIAVKANSRTTESVNGNVSKGLRMALSGGSVIGLSVTSLSLLGILVLVSLVGRNSSVLEIGFLTGYAMGASLTAIFIQIGGGIFTKSADIGADIVGKIEYRLPEDDPRNPAVIADLVGDNVGDCAGRGADLFETLSGDLVTSIIIGLGFIEKYGYIVLLFSPLFLSIGILSTLISIFTALRISDPTKSFLISLFVSTVSSSIGLYFVSTVFMKDITLFYAGLSGLLVTLLMALVSNHYTGVNSSPVKNMFESVP
ncbi:MAG: sodium/proton-translocating pyrophosphatase [Thermoproteota archaeon]